MNWISRWIKRRCDATEPPVRDPDNLSGPPIGRLPGQSHDDDRRMP